MQFKDINNFKYIFKKGLQSFMVDIVLCIDFNNLGY